MKAKYQSWCAVCDAPAEHSIEIGDEIKRVRYEGKERWVHAHHKWQPGKNVGRVRADKKPVLIHGGRVWHRARHTASSNALVYTLCGKLGRVSHQSEENLLLEGKHFCAVCSKRSS